MSEATLDERSLRDRLADNPRPAALWFGVAIFAILLEVGRFLQGVERIFQLAEFVVSGVADIPAMAQSNVADVAGWIGGVTAYAVVAFLLLFVVAIFLKAHFIPVTIVEYLGLEKGRRGRDYIEYVAVTLLLGIVVAVYAVTPIGGIVDALLSTFNSAIQWGADLPSLTSRETIPNQGHQTPEGGWEGTFLGLSPAWAWALRVLVVVVYALFWVVWFWKGYTIWRDHYREAKWSPRDDIINRFRGHYWGLFGFLMVFSFIIMAVWAPALAPVPHEHNNIAPYQHQFEYFDEDRGEVIEMAHGTANIQSRSQGGDSTVGPFSYDDFDRWSPMGTNQDGKDLFTLLVYGARTSLVIGLTAILLASFVAVTMSLMTSYYKGILDHVTILVTDSIIAIPAFLLVLMLMAVFQAAEHPIMEIYDGGLLLALIFAFAFWPGLWRSIRGPSLQVAEQDWVEAAKSYGQSPSKTMSKHMAPYLTGYMFIYASLLLGGIIIATAALSFLGLGINPPTPEWGRIVSEGRTYVSTSSWHISTISGLMIVFVVIGFNALGDGIRDAIDPESDVATSEAGAAATGGGG